MESDPPLMKLADEDDSLIQSFPDPTQTPSKSSLSYFTCSPLALPPSRTKSLKDSVHTEKPSSSSTEATNNKENINSNNVEMPKLGMGPIQMKRVKKGGDYNLRKSLAWDRAFFTDEGILDPRELNMITGINPYTCGRGLASISEEGYSSFSSGSRCRNESNDMEASKEAQLNKILTPKGNKVGNHDSLHHHKVAHKILSSDYSNRSGSKFGGCSEATPASSLKRPNLNLLRTAKKESKIPKLPMSKSGSCFSAMTKGSMTARHNLIPKPPINVQKNIGLKSSIKEVYGSQSKSNKGLENLRLPDKEVAQKTVRNLSHSSSKASSSTKSQLVQLDSINSGLEKIPNRFQSCEIQDESTPLTAKNLAQDTPTTSNKSLPSGLRLPSPSLRFFDQTTVSESVSLQQKRIQQSNTNTNTCSKRQNATPRTPSVSKGDKGVPCINECPDIVRKMQFECRGSDVESHKVIEQEKGILGQKGNMGIEKISLKGDEEIKVSHSTEQSGNEIKDEFVLHNEEKKQQNYNDTSVSTSGQFIQQPITEVQLDFREPSTSESELKIDEKNRKCQELGIIIGSLLETNIVAENSQNFNETYDQFQSKNLTLEGSETISDFSKTHEEEKATLFDISQVSEDVDQVFIDNLSPEKIANDILVSEQSISHGCDLHDSMETYDFQNKKDAMVLMKGTNDIKGQDNSLIIHPLNDVPFSDQWLTAIEAPKEDLSQTSMEQSDTIKSDTPKDNADSQRGKIGKTEEKIGATKLLDLDCEGYNIGQENDVAKVVDEKSLHLEDDSRCNTENGLIFEQPIEEVQLEFRDVASLIDDQNQSMGDDVILKTESVVQEAKCGRVFMQSLEDEGLDIELAKIENECRINEEVEAEKNENKTMLMKRSNNIKRQDKSLVIHPPNAVPFSDEWLAAIEAAGEEILTMKHGAVQHSPPDKSIPERNPWSPVKNKANQIGPYDCTKYTNAMPSDPH